MKANKLVALALPIMLMGGCVTVDKTESKEAKTEESAKEKESKTDEKASNSKEESKSSKDVQKVRVLAEDYPMYLIDLGNEFDKSFNSFNATVGDFFDGKKDRKDVLAKIDDMNKVMDKFEAIDPPNKYVDSQKDMEKAIVKYRKAFTGIERAFSQTADKNTGGKTDKEVIQQSETLIKEGDKYWLAVYQNMKEEVTKSNGGAVSSNEKTEVSNSSGVNVENVKKNVTDGTELIADWGIQTSDGFKASFIVKGGNTFEIYKAGSFPDKNNVVEGAWSYDKNAMTLKLHITKQMVNGTEAEVVRKDIDYIVQNYDKKSLQLLNKETNNTTRYVKQYQ
ncbi:DUF7018 domain-containing (lipo)protein [Bacillus cereus]|uniref:DUF7018 domain-containing (lipo)protein n=1 Tax=Bacillus cereus TaxID=1396 RepID=UPI003D185ECF